ncbi:unnamed protein product [Camellia sinensis]
MYAPVKLENNGEYHNGGDIECPASSFTSVADANGKVKASTSNPMPASSNTHINTLDKVKKRLHAMFWKITGIFVPCIKDIREKKLVHNQAVELVKFLCHQIANANYSKARECSTSYVKLESPELYFWDNVMTPKTMLCIWQEVCLLRSNPIVEPVQLYKCSADCNGLREVEKRTANASTIVAALIATMVFAAAITVPGGNNGDGYPVFHKRASFLIFGISDAFAFFSSMTSVLLFLSILTSRYGENDFLVIIPRRLIFGLISLFLSILSTMIAFGATLYLVFGDSYKTWIIFPMLVLPGIPAILFVFLQFPLLVDMYKSTYCTIFVKQDADMLL